MKANNDIRKAAKDSGIYLWQIAEKYGCNDGNFTRKLRFELSQPEKDRILAIIEQLKTNDLIQGGSLDENG